MKIVKCFNFPAKSGFTFGASAASSTPATGGFVFGTSTTASSTAAPGGFVFGSPSTSKSGATSTAGGGFVFGTSTTKTTTPATKGGAGFTFGTAPVKTTTADTTATTKTGITFGTPTTQTAAAKSVISAETTKTQVTAAPTKPAVTSTSGFPFGTSASTTTGSSESGGFNFGGGANKGFSFGTSSKEEKTSSEKSGFNFGGVKSSGFSFGTPSTKGEKPESVVQDSGKTENVGGNSNSSTLFGSTGSAGFSFGQKSFTFGSKSPEQKPDSTTSVTVTPKPVDSASGPKAEPVIFGADSSAKSGFQFQLDSSTTSTSENKDKDKSPFKFTFSPSKSSSTVPKSPDVDREGMYVNKEGEDDHIFFEPVIQLPDKVDVVTGEEDEKVLFEHRAKLFRFHNKEWKERGLGDIKILENKRTKRIRVLMRREQILKICCNHNISEDLDLKPMPNSNGKAWTWYAMDHSDDEPKCEQFSVRFKTPEIANKFKAAFDLAKSKVSGQSEPAETQTPSSPAVTSSRPPVMLQSLLSEDEDLVFVKEEKATPAQVAQARKFMLPDHFYLYENAPPCPGCVGCEDYQEGTKISRKTRTPSPKKKQGMTISVILAKQVKDLLLYDIKVWRW